MEELFKIAASYIALAVEAIGVAVIAIGSLEAVWNMFAVMRHDTSTARREVWLQYARWLIAGLTFQLAGDIIRTSIAPTWDDVGKLAAIALIRTFLTFFLDRDMESMREKLHARRGEAPKQIES
jgi:uncharacterized membrane protein